MGLTVSASPAGELPDMSLYKLESGWKNQEAQTVKLRVGVLLVSLILTNCGYACPHIIADLNRIEADLQKQDSNDVGLYW